MDLTSFSHAGLRNLNENINLELQRRRDGQIAQARAQAEEIARSVGISLAQLMATAQRPQKQSVAIKYRQGDKRWTGRGRQPQWIRDWVRAGNSLDELRQE